MDDRSLMTAPPWAGPGFARLRKDAPLHTSPEVLAVIFALADFERQKYWQNVGDAIGPLLQHQIPKSSFIVQWGDESDGKGVSPEGLRTSLRSVGPDGDLLVAGTVACLMSSPRLTLRANDLFPILGWDPRSADRSAQMCLRAFRLLETASQMRVVGTRRGTWCGRTNRDLSTHGPLFTLSRDFRQDDPDTFEIHLGEALAKYLDVQTALPRIAQVSQISTIASCQPSGSWARAYALAFLIDLRLNVKKPRALTRRRIFERFPRQPDVLNLLSSKNPSRAVDYDAAAWQILKRHGIIQTDPASLAFAPRSRLGFGEDFLDAPLRLVPGQGIAEELGLPAAKQQDSKLWE